MATLTEDMKQFINDNLVLRAALFGELDLLVVDCVVGVQHDLTAEAVGTAPTHPCAAWMWTNTARPPLRGVRCVWSAPTCSAPSRRRTRSPTSWASTCTSTRACASAASASGKA